MCIRDRVKLIVIHDQDSNDCKEIKNTIVTLIERENDQQSYLIRIACRELENWYLGDMNAIENVYPKFKASKHKNKAKYRNPDNVSGSDEMSKLIDIFSKGFASREIPKHMNLDENNSPSFNHLISGVRRFLNQDH